MKTKIISALIFLLVAPIGFSQGFVNLDFESANIPGNVNSGNISASDAFPGWTVTARFIFYDTVSLSGNSISIFDSNPPPSIPPIQGNYFAILMGPSSVSSTVSIGQTAQVPLSTQSITFWGSIGGMQITFNGQPLSFNATGSTANYTIYGADISAFAGQTGSLLFTESLFGTSKLDNIQFSSTAIPEPSELALSALGALLLGFRRRLNSPR